MNYKNHLKEFEYFKFFFSLIIIFLSFTNTFYYVIKDIQGDDFINYYYEIKNKLINNEINRKVKNYSINRSDLSTYYNVGKLLSEAGSHYGEGIIKEYSKRLTKDLGKGYTFSSLTRMKKFYLLLEKLATVSQHLTFGNYIELLSIDDINKVKYYIQITERENLSIRQLRERIKNNEYERLPESTKNKLINKEDIFIEDNIKNPIIIKNNSKEEINEKALQKLILEDITHFMKELGSGYSFIDKEYKIKLENTYNYIDLLFFNYVYNCFVVIELKVTELKKEHTGQIEVYMNYIDENIRSINQNKTIGIIICKENNNYVIKYCSDKKIISKEYKIV